MHLENLIFILLIAMAALFRFLARAGNRDESEPPGRSTSAPRRNQPIERPAAETDEERIRRFLEALGQPTSSKPPRPVAPRTNVPPRPLAPVQPPTQFPLPIPPQARRRVVHPSSVKEEKVAAPSPALEERTTTAPPPPPPAEPVFEVQERAPALATTSVIDQPEIAEVNLVTLLKSPAGLRNAIVLREIFGPPRALQIVGSLPAS
jgi:hypothetical protein